MNKLFIIGNGFDLMHKIPSRYEDFRQYLVTMLEKMEGKSYRQYDFTNDSIITSNYIESPTNEILTILYFLSVAESNLTDNKNSKTSYDSNGQIMWKNIENSVGKLDYSAFINLYFCESENDEEFRNNDINMGIISPYKEVLGKIHDYFKEWVNQISITNISKNQVIEKYFDGNSLFLCFNYTNTLEKIYNINKKNICYIHGKAKDNNKIFFGHGNNRTYEDYVASNNNLNYLSACDAYLDINDVLCKPVQDIIENNLEFFTGLHNINTIYSYGFSYGSVDKPYIKKICSCIKTSNSKWSINSYPSEEEKNEYKKFIKECGYDGDIGEFGNGL